MCGCFFVKKQSILGQCVFSLLAIKLPCKVVSRLTQFLTSESPIPAHMAFPSFLLEMTELSDSAKIIYCVLLYRVQLSQKRDGFTDENGRIFIYYPIKDLAEAVHKSEMSVKTALSALEKCGLIFRKRQGLGKANRIYVKFPVDRKLSVRQTESCPPDGKKTVCQIERKLSGRYIERDNKNIANRMRKAYGKSQNVFLSDDDISILQRTVPPYREYIERLSAYMLSSGKSYADHAATIRSWYLRDNPPPARNYESEENESL